LSWVRVPPYARVVVVCGVVVCGVVVVVVVVVVIVHVAVVVAVVIVRPAVVIGATQNRKETRHRDLLTNDFLYNYEWATLVATTTKFQSFSVSFCVRSLLSLRQYMRKTQSGWKTIFNTKGMRMYV